MTQLKSFSPSGFQNAWDSTSLGSFAKCPRYYQLKHLEGWQADNRSPHLIFGGVYAAALEQYFKHTAAGASPDEALLRVIRSALIETWDHERDGDGARLPGTGAAWESTHNTKNRDTLIRSIVWYFGFFSDDPTTTIQLTDGRPAVELSFSLPLSDEYLYCGHIDRLVSYGGDTFVMDQKTTGTTITAHYFHQFSPDIQMSGYSWAGKILFNLPISGVIIDAAQIAVGFTRFERGFVHRSAPILEEWHDNALALIDEARRAHDSGVYRMNQTACGNYGGCEFRDVCNRAPEHRNAVLHQGFHRAPRWDPLERRN